MKAYIMIFSFSIFGGFVSKETGIPIPGSIIGLVLFLIFITLNSKVDSELKQASQTLLQYLPLFLLPIGLSVIELIKGDLNTVLAIITVSITSLIIAVISTIAIMKITLKASRTFQPKTSK